MVPVQAENWLKCLPAEDMFNQRWDRFLWSRFGARPVR